MLFAPPALSHSVTIVIPCLNEEGNLEKLFYTLDRTFQNLGFTLPVLLIDDGSTDQTPQILTQLCCQYAYLKTIRHPQKRGVTGVWKTAIAHVNTEWVFWGQADLESDFQSDLPLLLEACVPGVDGVAGWRQQRGDGKVMASKFANLACRMSFGLKIHDMNWIKLVRRDILTKVPFDVVTHRYLLAILAGWGYNITEVATPWHPRFSGQSKFGRGRLVTSAMNFSRTWWWFHIENRLLLPFQYIPAMFKAVDVGFRAGKEAFDMQVNRDRVASNS
ncbi:glycosyltransferase family 2 protein [Chroococcidiopsis thermalis]|uniref:Glycosyl transferase family 2 n=1 Tax=Chroococcidiopsis thermalis (strain PCC 7203) TaxID=251229 RepID=K9TSW9_CHRTP|nr:glycosyltransferase family 2 protein [Chroococcidiopsis thermalis]AFY85917.1 glycosyl transferase family 2 [Chroococcidiopsis thermalis PCC 7203]PSB42895.1 glycosyltransferase family 2 protein [Cyanosarcina cf. burmensis CCALA 770]